MILKYNLAICYNDVLYSIDKYLQNVTSVVTIAVVKWERISGEILFAVQSAHRTF